MADKTSFIFVAHEGKKRANAPANESKRIRSELQRRTWQERRLKSAQRLRESATVPTNVSAVSRACRHAGLTDAQPAGAVGRLRAKTIVCPLCGQRIDVRMAPTVQSLVDDGNLDPFDSSVVKMTKQMQKVLRIGELAKSSFWPMRQAGTLGETNGVSSSCQRCGGKVSASCGPGLSFVASFCSSQP